MADEKPVLEETPEIRKALGSMAYPIVYQCTKDGQDFTQVAGGLSKRQWCAGLMMQALVTGMESRDDTYKLDETVADAWRYADALLQGGT